MAVDFLIRKKNAALAQYIALEIKQNSNIRSCIKGMMQDINKVAKVRGSHDDLRSMWILGIHPYVEPNALMEIVDEYANSYDVGLLASCKMTQRIGRTSFSYTLF